MSEDIDNLREAILMLAAKVDALLWRVASDEEKGHIRLLQQIRVLLDQ